MSLIMQESHLFFQEDSTAQLLGLQFIKRTSVKTEHCYDINLHEYGKKWIIIFLFMRWRELSQQIWILVYKSEFWIGELKGHGESQRLLFTQRSLRVRESSSFVVDLTAKMVQSFRFPKARTLFLTHKRGWILPPPWIQVSLNIWDVCELFNTPNIHNELNISSKSIFEHLW